MKKDKRTRAQKKADKIYAKNLKKRIKKQNTVQDVTYRGYNPPGRLGRGEKQAIAAIAVLAAFCSGIWAGIVSIL